MCLCVCDCTWYSILTLSFSLCVSVSVCVPVINTYTEKKLRQKGGKEITITKNGLFIHSFIHFATYTPEFLLKIRCDFSFLHSQTFYLTDDTHSLSLTFRLIPKDVQNGNRKQRRESEIARKGRKRNIIVV